MKFHHSVVRTIVQSPLGEITIAATDAGLAGLWFAGQKHWPPQLIEASTWPSQPEHQVLEQVSRQLSEYFSGVRTAFDVPLDLSGGTAFQQAVWQVLLTIPRGATASYGNVSRRAGSPAAVRAVGAAIGRNPVSIIVPCHRVIGSNGLLTGYAGGLERKTALLRLEGALQESLI